MSKKNLFPLALLFCWTYCIGQYDYGIEVEQHDTKIEGKLNIVDGVSSVFIGENAGINDDGTDNQNTFIGVNAGLVNSDWLNTFVGYNSAFNSTGGQNTSIGAFAGRALTTGFANTFVGNYGGHRVTSGKSNVMIGIFSGSAIDEGNNNTIVGASSGPSSGSSLDPPGNNNVYIGYLAGRYLTKGDSFKLVIESEPNHSYPLIYGEFDNNYLQVNGTIHISETAKLEPQATAPSCNTGEMGSLYSGTNGLLYFCNGSSWKTVQLN